MGSFTTFPPTSGRQLTIPMASERHSSMARTISTSWLDSGGRHPITLVSSPLPNEHNVVRHAPTATGLPVAFFTSPLNQLLLPSSWKRRGRSGRRTAHGVSALAASNSRIRAFPPDYSAADLVRSRDTEKTLLQWSGERRGLPMVCHPARRKPGQSYRGFLRRSHRVLRPAFPLLPAASGRVPYLHVFHNSELFRHSPEAI